MCTKYLDLEKVWVYSVKHACTQRKKVVQSVRGAMLSFCFVVLCACFDHSGVCILVLASWKTTHQASVHENLCNWKLPAPEVFLLEVCDYSKWGKCCSHLYGDFYERFFCTWKIGFCRLMKQIAVNYAFPSISFSLLLFAKAITGTLQLCLSRKCRNFFIQIVLLKLKLPEAIKFFVTFAAVLQTLLSTITLRTVELCLITVFKV